MTMINKLKKIFHYIANYRQFKSYSAMIDDPYTFPLYKDHFLRTIQYNCVQTNTQEKLLTRIVLAYHTIEKGLNKADLRLGFGSAVVSELVGMCDLYSNQYIDKSQRLIDAINVLNEYLNIHKQANYDIDPAIQKRIELLVEKYQPLPEYTLTRLSIRDYFSIDSLDFASFAQSRHSVRDFEGTPVDSSLVDDAIILAQTAPSACNRQSVRLHVVWNKEKLDSIAELQRGGRGFIDKANPIIVISYELQDWIAGEQWFGGYVDAGIYLMNLLYSLHYYKVAACPLNWYATLEEDHALHQLLSIPQSQVVVGIIACGNAKDELGLVKSNRLSIDEIKTDIR